MVKKISKKAIAPTRAKRAGVFLCLRGWSKGVETEEEKGRSDRRAQWGREKGRRMEEGKRRKAGKAREAEL